MENGYQKLMKVPQVSANIYENQRSKRDLMYFAFSEGPDQPAQMRMLIRAFVDHLLHGSNGYYGIGRQRMLPSNSGSERPFLKKCLIHLCQMDSSTSTLQTSPFVIEEVSV